MRKLIHSLFGTVLLVMVTAFALINPAKAQQSLIQVNGWNAYVHLPSDYTTSKVYPTIIEFPGLGEVGTDASLVIEYGPGAYIAQGWNGNIGSVEFIVISLQPAAAYPAVSITNAAIASLKTLYNIDPNNLFLTGYSEGGWCTSMFVSSDPVGGPYTYASQVKAICTVEGVIPSDNSDYPDGFAGFAQVGGKDLCFEQINDGRDGGTVVNEMNSTVANSAYFYQTDFDGGGHCCWSNFYGGGGTAPGVFPVFGTNETIYQWFASLVTTTTSTMPVISSATSATGTINTAFSYTITASNTPTSYAETGLPAGLSLNTSTGVINGTPTVPGTFSVTISATNSSGTVSATLSITINPPAPLISSASTATGAVGTAFTYTIVASNSPSGYSAAGLPAGLSVNTSSGIISGTPTAAGTSTVTLSAINATGTGTKTLTITINAAAPVITSTATATGTKGAAFSYNIIASNTPTSYGATGLPSGLSVNTSTGVISGTPTAVGTSTVTISAINTTGTGTLTLTITINPPAPAISSAVTATGTVGTAFTYTITASNTPISYGATGLPSGLSINTSTGILSGTPAAAGTFSVTLSAINAGGAGTKTLAITINQPAPIISSPTSATGISGIAFTYTITASNSPTSYAATGLPTGLSISTSTGVISGTPTTSGTFNVSISAINSSGTVNAMLSITINLPAPVISSAISATGTLGTSFTYTITASNSPTSYAATGLPSGLSVNTSTGVISGTPIVSGTSTVTLNAINATGTGTKTLTITINPATPVISSIATAVGTKGIAFSYTITASNNPTSYAAASLPAGLSINALTGVISGTPTVSGISDVTISAINAGGTGSKTLVITINAPIPSLPVISSKNSINAAIGVVFNYTITASNTPTSYGATGLPSGLSIDTTMGLISGVPAKSGIFDVTISATNAGGTATATLVITITAPVVVNAGTNQVIILPVNTVTLSGTVTDGGASISSYNWVKISGPSSGTITSASSASTTVSNLTAGVYQFELIVTNSLGATGKDTVQVTVNTHPVANAGVDESITLPVNTVTLSGSGTDAGGTISSYQWAKVSGPTTGTITNTSSATTTVTGLVQGVYKFVLTVTDNFGLSNSDTVSVTVNAANINQSNTPPVANAGADQLIILPVNTVTLSGSASDKDASIVSYKWTKLSGPSAGAITTATSASTTVTGLTAGIYQFVITVTDSKGLTGKDTVQIIVHTPPVANAGADQIINYPASTVTLSGSATDADGTIVSYQWTKLSGPSTVTITNASSAGTTVTGLTAGVYQFVLTVTDNDGATGKDTMEVTVNTPPVVNAGTNITITLPVSTVTLSGSATDATGTVVSYLWSQIAGPVSASIVGAASNSTSVTGLTTKGTYQFVLTVKNNLGQTGKDTITVTVLKHVSLPPVANAGSDITISLPTNTVALSGSATDSGGTVVSYHWSQVSGPSASTITDSTTAQASVSNLEEGVYEYELTVMNNDSLTATATMTVTVTASSKLSMKVLAGPNPVQSTLTVQVSNLSETNQKLLVTLTSVSGATVYSSVVPAGQSTVDTKINMGNFGTGIYFLKITNEETEQSVTKMIYKN